MLDGYRMGYGCISAAYFFWNLRMQFGQSFYMCFVNNGLVIRCLGRFVAFPVKVWIYYYGFGNKRSTIRLAKTEVGFLAAYFVSIQRIVPLNSAGNSFGVRVYQQF